VEQACVVIGIPQLPPGGRIKEFCCFTEAHGSSIPGLSGLGAGARICRGDVAAARFRAPSIASLPDREVNRVAVAFAQTDTTSIE
jgi:hypothetical protein